MVKEKIIVTKLAPGRFLGVAAAAKALRVNRQSVYKYLDGWAKALGPKKRERLEVVDLTVNGPRGARALPAGV